jgi:hypothetical protein
MSIHHAIIKKAEKAGIRLEDLGTDEEPQFRYKAHWPEYNQVLFGPEVKYLLDDMLHIKEMRKNYQSFKVEIQDDQTVHITVRGTDIEVKGMRAAAAFGVAKKAWLDSRASLDIEDEEEDNEVEAEIDEAHLEDEDERSGSVVSASYRAKYAEAGHPNTCGDWLANILNDQCLNKAGFNDELFEQICTLNGVDLSKYNRTTRGWQGRLRMTGRNLLARRVAINDQLVLPNDTVLKADPDWRASQRYQAPKVSPTPTTPKLAPKAD